MTLRPDLVFLPLDDDVLVFSEEAQCLVGLNASAALIARELHKGIPVSGVADTLSAKGVVSPQEAAHWVNATWDALAANGLLTGGHAPPSDAEMRDSVTAERIAQMPAYVPFEPIVERRYRLLNACVLIRFSLLRQVPWVDTILHHLAADASSQPTEIIDIVAGQNESGALRAYVYRDGQPVDYVTGLNRLGPLVKIALWQSAVNAHDFGFYFHAGVVGTGDSCILLPAAAGSGKSSLTAALTHKGFRYFSDEVALIERGTFRVAPMPLAFCLKESGWTLMSRYFPEIMTLPIHQRYDAKMVRYMQPPAAAVAQASGHVSHIVFPRYQPGVQTVLEPVARSTALRRLMEECLALRQRLNRDNVGALIRWIEGIECYALTFSSLDEACARVTQIATGVDTPPAIAS
jgi:hypothetical protein